MIQFNLKCYTYWGQNVFLRINGETIGMTYTNDSTWQCAYEATAKVGIDYSYYVLNPEQTTIYESPEVRHLPALSGDLQVFDTFRYASTARVFRTTPFVDALCAHKQKRLPKLKQGETLLLVNAPAIDSAQGIALLGNTPELGAWNDILPMQATDDANWFIILPNANLRNADYKFVVYDLKSQELVRWELGENRHCNLVSDDAQMLSCDFRQEYNWHGAGTAIPVFSLRSDEDWGVGEFYDLKAMVDWAQATGQKILQILPINDTTNQKSNADSYPYSANSVYALHPMYLNMSVIGQLKDKKTAANFEKNRKQLNASTFVDYAKVNALKWDYLRLIFAQEGAKTLASDEYKNFFKANQQWLTPYAVFCLLRDMNGTSDFRQWGNFAEYDERKVATFAKEHAEDVALHYFVQFHLAKQLTEVREYAHKHSVVLKGDLPIGISPNSVDAWMYPNLFHLDKQAGAPPDDFSVTGQNWGFPTYNWDEMEKDGFKWWKQRFQNMANYFDAYRIDHILGFFRIWEMPKSAIWGLLGYFNPAMPMHLGEIENYGLHFDAERMLHPYITDSILDELFGTQKGKIIKRYLVPTTDGRYQFREECDTQRKLNDYFYAHKTANEDTDMLDKLLELHTEVLFIEDAYHKGKYHPRITVYKSRSFAALSEHDKSILGHIHEDYFYHRQAEFWRIQALRKLPALLRTTNMLVCGEDLGMVPNCVPQVMADLQILSLEIQRMPKDVSQEFVLPWQTPYLSVCSTGTHDTSPLRSWWHENQTSTQHYYNNVLHCEGAAPTECTAQIAEQIVDQQLGANGMLVILPLQDYLAMDEQLRFPNADGERINDPSNPHHFWCYRMHLTIKQLQQAQAFNSKLKALIVKHNRA